jgi:hypothetical protein
LLTHIIHLSSRRDLAAALTVFFMRLELARAHALEGFRPEGFEGADYNEMFAAEVRRAHASNPLKATYVLYGEQQSKHSLYSTLCSAFTFFSSFFFLSHWQ